LSGTSGVRPYVLDDPQGSLHVPKHFVVRDRYRFAYVSEQPHQ
jgi:hypothetical protein